MIMTMMIILLRKMIMMMIIIDHEDAQPSKLDQGTLVTGGLATAVVSSPLAACRTSPRPSAMHSWSWTWSSGVKLVMILVLMLTMPMTTTSSPTQSTSWWFRNWPPQENSQAPSGASSQVRQCPGTRQTSCRWSETPGGGDDDGAGNADGGGDGILIKAPTNHDIKATTQNNATQVSRPGLLACPLSGRACRPGRILILKSKMRMRMRILTMVMAIIMITRMAIMMIMTIIVIPLMTI